MLCFLRNSIQHDHGGILPVMLAREVLIAIVVEIMPVLVGMGGRAPARAPGKPRGDLQQSPTAPATPPPAPIPPPRRSGNGSPDTRVRIQGTPPSPPRPRATALPPPAGRPVSQNIPPAQTHARSGSCTSARARAQRKLPAAACESAS